MYFHNIFHRVIIGNSVSSARPVKSGVPQGSVLEHIFSFSEYGAHHMYADDMQLCYSYPVKEWSLVEFTKSQKTIV